MPIDSMVYLIGNLLREICLFQGSGFLEGSYVRRCPKAMPSSIPHNSQLPPPIEVSLNVLEADHGELSLVHHINPVAFSLFV
jgi:hypothetical protein